MRRNKGGSIEGIMDGGREGGIRNREHFGKIWEVIEGSGGFRGVLENYGKLRVAMASFGKIC